MADVDQVVALLKEAKVDRAFELMKRVEDKKTLSEQLSYLGGFFSEAQSRYHLAVALLLSAHRFDPENPNPLYNLANTYSTPYMLFDDPRNLDKAFFWYTRALKLDPDFHEARYNLSLLFFFTQKTVEAKKQYDILMSKKPHHPKYRELGLLLEGLK